MARSACFSSPVKKHAFTCTSHIRTARPSSVWLTPVVHLATSTGLTPRQIADAQTVVLGHIKEIEDAWNHHFGG